MINPGLLNFRQKLLLALSIAMAICVVLAGGLYVMLQVSLHLHGTSLDMFNGLGVKRDQFPSMAVPVLGGFCYVVFSLFALGGLSLPPKGRLIAAVTAGLLLIGCLYAEWVIVDGVVDSLVTFVARFQQTHAQ